MERLFRIAILLSVMIWMWFYFWVDIVALLGRVGFDLEEGAYEAALPGYFYTVTAMGFLVSLLGMFFYLWWARALFVVMLLSFALDSVLSGGVGRFRVDRFFWEASLFLDGAILAMAFSDDLRRRFKRRAV